MKVVGKWLSDGFSLEVTRVTRHGQASIMFRVARQQLGLDFWTSSLLLPRWGYRLARQKQNIDCASSLQAVPMNAAILYSRQRVCNHLSTWSGNPQFSFDYVKRCWYLHSAANQITAVCCLVPKRHVDWLDLLIAQSEPLCLFTVCCLQSWGYVQVCTVWINLFTLQICNFVLYIFPSSHTI